MNTLWHIFHPRRSRRLNEELTARLSALEEELKRAEERIKALEDELEAERRMTLQERRRADAFRERLTQSQQQAAQADSLREQLTTEQEETSRVVAEISRQLDQVEKMRASYERRIAHLHHALCESRERLRLYSSIELDTPIIDMQQPSAPVESENSALNSQNTPNDWLMPLPE